MALYPVTRFQEAELNAAIERMDSILEGDSDMLRYFLPFIGMEITF